MGYETKAVIAVNKIDYPNGVDWKNWAELIEYQDQDEFKIRYEFEWSKATHKAVEYFISKVVLVDEEEYPRIETFGIISIGEEYDDTETWGDYWDYDIGIHRSIEVY